MKSRIRDQGIVSRISEYSESSLIIKAFAREQGSISIIAKGIRKQKDKLCALSCYDLNLYEPSDGGLYILSEFNLQREYAMFGDPEKWAAAECALELLSGLIIPHEENPAYFSLLCRYLDFLEGATGHSILLWWRFLLRVFLLLGVPLNLRQCSLCHRELKTLVAYGKSSCEPVCLPCHDEDPLRCEGLSSQSARILSLLPEIGNFLKTIQPTRQTVQELNSYFSNYHQVHFARPLRLKSVEVLEQFYL